MRAATALTASNGFRKTGIYPTNRHIFEDHEFAPSTTTDTPLPEVTPPLSVAPSTTTDMPMPEVTPPLSVTPESNVDKFSVECNICH